MGCACTHGFHKNKVVDDPSLFKVVPDSVAVPTPKKTGELVSTSRAPGKRVSIMLPPNSKDQPWDTSACLFPLQLLPMSVRMVLFPYFASPFLLFNLLQVSRAWHSTLTEPEIWAYLCSVKYAAPVFAKVKTCGETHPAIRLYTTDVTRNLIRNAQATTVDEHKKCWRICGGDSDTLPKFDDTGSRSTMSGHSAPAHKCWVFAHRKVHRKQVINLEGLGIPPTILDDAEPPPLYVSECYSGENATFRLKIRLLGAWSGAGAQQEILEKYDSGDLLTTTADACSWHVHTHCFQHYPRGLRYIAFEDFVSDALITNACVQFFVQPNLEFS